MAEPMQKDPMSMAGRAGPVVYAARNYNWLTTGNEVFPSMLQAIESANESIRLESYIYSPGQPGERFRDALVRARGRGVNVRVLVDALGSFNLPMAFWEPLLNVGGEVRYFNPIKLHRLGLRNHRKLLVCDDAVGFVGGFNIAPEYEGDGVTCGWCDLGLKIEGPLAKELAESFDLMFARADFRHKRFAKLRRAEMRRTVGSDTEQLLLSGPGRGRNLIQQALQRDLAGANSVRMIVAYFLPTWGVRRQLARVVSTGGCVELILGGKSDVGLSLLAAQSLYRRMLRAGITVHEYQPQILHAKLYIIDNIVYVGSANLDPRSLRINYELMIRFNNPEIARQAHKVFNNTLNHLKRIDLEKWNKNRTLWERLKQRWAYLVLVRLDPYIARHQWQTMPD